MSKLDPGLFSDPGRPRRAPAAANVAPRPASPVRQEQARPAVPARTAAAVGRTATGKVDPGLFGDPRYGSAQPVQSRVAPANAAPVAKTAKKELVVPAERPLLDHLVTRGKDLLKAGAVSFIGGLLIAKAINAVDKQSEWAPFWQSAAMGAPVGALLTVGTTTLAETVFKADRGPAMALGAAVGLTGGVVPAFTDAVNLSSFYPDAATDGLYDPAFVAAGAAVAGVGASVYVMNEPSKRYVPGR